MTPRTLLRLHGAARRVPLGRTALSLAIRAAAPYFLTLPATVDVIEPGRSVAHMQHRPWVRNHLGTVHAIALCNLAELAMGMAAEATVPPSHRWIPRAMQVEYVAKATGRLTGTATLALPTPLAGRHDVEVPVEVVDAVVFTAVIEILVTRRPAG